jgi:hypothetical protein
MSQPNITLADGFVGDNFVTAHMDVPLDAANPPPTSAFTIWNGSTWIPASSVAVDSAAMTVTVGINYTFTGSEIVVIQYFDPTLGDDVNAVQGVDGADANDFSFVFLVSPRPGPPAPAAPTLDSGSDSGLPGDGITSDDTPTVSGTAAANATVKLYDTDGTTLLGTGTADGFGNWSITSSTLGNGSHTLTVTQTDSGNNTSPASTGLTVNIDTAAAAPVGLALAAGSDSGTVGDGITNAAVPTITGQAEANAAVTLYDTDGTTVLGSTTADGSGNWSIGSSALTEGTHNLTAKQTDPAGNVSAASTAAAVTVDTIGPTGMALSTTSAQTTAATNGATVATLSATDATAVHYDLAVGNGVIDADNGKFTVSGNNLVAAQNLAAGAYHIYLKATDAAGNDAFQIFTFNVVNAPSVASIERAGASTVPASSTAVAYTVTFDQAVTGVDASDFALTFTGTAAGTVASVTGSGATYTVSVNGIGGDGTLRLDLNSSGTGIQSLSGGAIAGGYTAGQSFSLDHTAPAAPAALAVDPGSDSGAPGDGISATTTPVVGGTADANATVTLYDTDGATVLGTATADGSGNWSITSATLAEGAHTLTAKQVDAAGNVSSASSGLSYEVDTTPPGAVGLSRVSVPIDQAGNGAAVATLAATDAHAVAYSFATGNGTVDADNARFTISGNSLVASQNLAAGTYHVYVQATDAAGNATISALSFDVIGAPGVSSIMRTAAAPALTPAASTSVSYTVTFDQAVTGVDASDFALTASGTAAGAVASVSGSGTTYTVTVNGIAGDGDLRLDLNPSGTGIQNAGGTAVAGGYTAGQSFSLDHTAPAAPAALAVDPGSDSGAPGDGISAAATPVIGGTADANATVTLYDTDGATVLGTTTADGSGNWSITSATLAEGAHTLTAKQIDAAGNVSAASSGLSYEVDTTPPGAVGLSRVSVPIDQAGNGAAVATLAATDAHAVAYTFATGNGTVDADNARFTISGSSLVASQNLAAGTYHVYVQATDAAGNATIEALSFEVIGAPGVASIVRAGADTVPANATTVTYTVTFDQAVTGVDASDFALTGTGTAAGTVASVTGSGTTYTITVNGIGGDGALRLDLNPSGTGIQNAGGTPVAGGYTAGQTYSLDHTAPAAPAALAVASGSDTGASPTDGISATTTPVVGGTADANATVTLYDTDGATVLGTATADGSGNWSITSATLTEGAHTLTAKQVDAAGNVSSASSGLSYEVDTTPPGAVGLSRVSVPIDQAGNGAAVATLAATDAHAVAYTFATGNGTVDADNARFTISGSSLVASQNLAAGTYHVYVQATDAAGNATIEALSFEVIGAPGVASIVRGGADTVPANATTVTYTVAFDQAVTGVDASDFTLMANGTAAGTVASVTGSGTTYTVTVNGIAGDGTLRLDLNPSGTGIQNAGGTPVAGGYTAGQTFSLDHTAPAAPAAFAMAAADDSGASNSDAVTSVAAPHFSGTAVAGAAVTLYDTDGSTVLGTATADGSGNWTIASATLAAGAHTLTVRQADAAGNVSAASPGLAVKIDATAPTPAAPALAAPSDTGVAGDGITGNGTPTITGTGEAFATVTLYDTDGATVLGTATADADGLWSIASTTLAAGAHTLTVKQTDAAGNVSAASAALNLTIDATAPAAPAAPQLAAASDTGTVGDGVTSDFAPVFNGSAEAFAGVVLYDTDGTVLGNATADAGGNWSISSTALALGSHALTVKATDAAGNVSAASAAFNLSVITAPTPATTIDGVQVIQAPVQLPGGESGTQTVVPIVTAGRTESSGTAGVADIPLATAAGATVLLAQLGAGFGLSSTGGTSRPAGSSVEQLIQAILASTQGHAAADQGHLTSNGQSFLNLLPSQVPLLVQTVKPVTDASTTGATLTLTGTSTDSQHTALVIDTGGVASGNTLTLKNVDFAAVIGAGTVVGTTSGQVLTGDIGNQTFVVGAGQASSLLAGGGNDTLQLDASGGASGSANGAARADARAAAATLMHGGAGGDTARFAGQKASYTIENHDGQVVVTDTGGTHDQAYVVNVETLQFADGSVNVENRATLTALAGLYADTLGRQADVAGFEFWGNAEQRGASLGQIAVDIIASSEGQTHQQAFNGDAAHDIGVLYQAVFHRTIDSGGAAFWLDAMQHGATLQQVADQLMHSTEIVGHALEASQWDFLV